jgi:DNA-binding transcriptional ArsR family regulator
MPNPKPPLDKHNTKSENVPQEERISSTSGWLLITRNRSVNKMIDTLLDLPPHREFHKSELADLADVSRNSVGTHIDLLLELEIVESVPGTSPTRYRFNTDSEVSRKLMELDGIVKNKLESTQD